MVRHGESKANAAGVVSTDETPLSDMGRKEVKQTALELSKYHLDELYSSDLPRAAETAQIIAKECGIDDITYVKALREAGSGDYSGLSQEEASIKFREFIEASDDHLLKHPAGGESVIEHRDRVMEFVYRIIAEEKGNILLVAHGGTNKIIFGTLTGIPLKEIHKGYHANCSVSILDIEEEVEVILEADTSHLD